MMNARRVLKIDRNTKGAKFMNTAICARMLMQTKVSTHVETVVSMSNVK